jgi:hypothetical protein
MVTIVGLPQRIQIVNGQTATAAGVASMPLLLSSAVGSAIGGAIMAKKNVTFYMLLISNICQAIGTGLLSSIGPSKDTPPRMYGFEVIMGFGMGLSIISLMIMGRLEFQVADQGMTLITHGSASRKHVKLTKFAITILETALVVGALTQLRMMGAVIGLGIASTVFTEHVKSRLAKIVSSAQLDALLKSPRSIVDLSPEHISAARIIYNDAYNLQMQIVMGFALASLVVALMTFQKHPHPIPDMDIQKKMEAKGEEVERKCSV